MKKTLTLPESEIIALANVAKGHGTVALAKLIGIGKSQLYKILRGHNCVTPETADKISTWLSTYALPPKKTEEPEQRPSGPLRPSNPVINWNDPKFLRLAAVEVAAAILQGRLTNISITIGGQCKCGD